MKILYLVDKPNLYGSERHLLDIIDSFQGYHDVELIAFSEGPMLSKLKGINVKVFNLSWMFNFILFYKFFAYVKEVSPDIVHCHQPKAVLFGGIIGRILKIPTIITVHSRAYDHAVIHRNVIRRTFVYVFHKLISLVSIMLASKVIYVNEEMYNRSASKKKAVYISNWLSKTFFLGEKKVLDEDKVLKFISVGSVTKAKGYDILLEFFYYLDKNEIPYTSIVYGGIDENFFSCLKSRRGFSNKIKFLGYRDLPASSFREADFYVLFSRSETFGLSYLEAMSQGLPIVSLDLCELKKLIPEGNVLEKDARDAFFSFFRFLNSNSYSEISKKNIDHAKNYSCKVKMKELENIYLEIFRNE